MVQVLESWPREETVPSSSAIEEFAVVDYLIEARGNRI